MKKKTSLLKICGAVSALMLFAGCNGNNGQEIDLAPFPDETQGTSQSYSDIRKAFMTPFIMPQAGTEDYNKYSAVIGEENCLPGRLYLTYDSSSNVTIKLSDTVYREETGVFSTQPKERIYLYAVAIGESGDYLMKVDKETGWEQVLYHAKGSPINCMTSNSQYSSYTIYFSAGDKICVLDTETDEIEQLTVFEGGISDLVYTGGTVAWTDSSGQYYRYYFETGEIAEIGYEDLHPFYELYEYTFYPRGDDVYAMYKLDRGTEEVELVLENITKISYAEDVTSQFIHNIFVRVEDEELGAYIASVDTLYGYINVIYYAQTDDMELLTAAIQTYAPVLYVKEGEDIFIMKGVSEPEKLFSLENGLMENHDGEGYEFYSYPSAQVNKEVLERSTVEIEGLEDFYICEECGDEYCIWADSDGNYFWYHPHSEENEEIEVTYFGYNALILQKD